MCYDTSIVFERSADMKNVRNEMSMTLMCMRRMCMLSCAVFPGHRS
jgi:hypothetical protein